MHIEPGVVEGGKMVLAYATGAASLVAAAGLSRWTVKNDGGLGALAARSVIVTALVVIFFAVLPHYTRGISEVHFIFGATLYLVFGAGPAAIGLALGLFLQGAVLEPRDLPQYFINVTTLTVPLLLVVGLVRRMVPLHTPYVNLKLWQALALSAAYQGGTILMVAFWALYGRGFGAGNLDAIGYFAVSYLVVILIEPLVSMLLLAIAKAFDPSSKGHPLLYNRLHHPVS